MPDHYKILNVDPKADPEVVRGAYRALAKKYTGDDARMLVLNTSYDVLKDAGQRKAYDADRRPKKNSAVGNYVLLDKIAEGGFGETYKARHADTGALSCVKYALNLDPEDEAFLIEEAKAMWELRHYGIPAIRDLIRTPDGKLGLVMSYIEGLTLAQIVERHYPGGMDAEHVAWITERTLNVLKYLHMHGVVHGDVKPQNIIVQPATHTVVLLDYGLSRVRPKAGSGANGYTPYFCAPEQLEFKTPIPETDLYGLGMTIVFALGGDVAHVRVPENTPKHLCAFIKELIRLDPLKRPKVWGTDLCDVIREVREKDFGRAASGMKPLKV